MTTKLQSGETSFELLNEPSKNLDSNVAGGDDADEIEING